MSQRMSPASATVSDPERRARLERLEEWAARRTPTEHDEIEQQAATAIRERDGRGRVH